MAIWFYLSLFSLGALDALQPGHAKALVSSALVGTNANMRQVLLLGVVVALTHALINSVLALGVTFLALRFFPDAFIRYVEIFTGIAVVLIALYLIWQRFFQVPQTCCHLGGDATGEAHHHPPVTEMTLGQIVSLGLVSGLSPCPVVLTALMSAIAVGKGWDAFWGISVFSAGMGTVLVGVGYFTLFGFQKARHTFLSHPRQVLRFSQACACVVLALGGLLLGKALFFYEPEQEAPMSLFFQAESDQGQ